MGPEFLAWAQLGPTHLGPAWADPLAWAHWPTKENGQFFYHFFDFFGPWRKLPGMAPNGAGKLFFRLIQTLPSFWATRILILRIFIFWIVLGPKFLAWAQLGPTHLGPAWAHPLGPGLGPPTWARRGPTHVGPPTWAQLGPTHLDFQTAPAPDELSNPDPGPSQRTQG